MYADIIVEIQHEKLDKVFQYKVPDSLKESVAVGTAVIVPFGISDKRTKGYVVDICDSCSYDESKIKEILDIAGDSISIEGKLVALAVWMKERYGGTMLQALRTVIPIRQKENIKVKRTIRLIISKEDAKAKSEYFLKKKQKARARLLAALLDAPVIDYFAALHELNITRPVIQALQEQGVCAIESDRVYRSPMRGEKQEKKVTFTDEQRHVIGSFKEDYEKGERGVYLIHGVTGSGKTEVYTEMIRHVISMGKQAIVLIPEIALTYQTMMRFYKNFGDRVAVMHSRLSLGERFDQMMRAKEGKADVMVGPRSALFTPFLNLGLIVIDEEHELTYKSGQTPRYHARETAIQRAGIEGASVVLGSATPSLESMYRAKQGEYKLFELKNRYNSGGMAKVHTVDLRQELKDGNRSILSRKLQELMEDRLKKKEQIMLFLNRRGYAGFVSCRQCGHVIKCPHCDVALSYHKNGKLICHYCGYREDKPNRCPKCGSKYIGQFRAGTQQIEEIVKIKFPQAKVLRMDLDTTAKKGGHEKILSAFSRKEADILVGTQMIVKGHDFPNLTLAGVLAADMSLYGDDYRAAERTFQLITQAVGRSGRAGKKGEAVIQTYSPDHYAIKAAARQDYKKFYEEEINFRTLMGYPPVWNLLAVLAGGEDEELLDMACGYLKKFAMRLKNNFDINVIGPSSPAVGKVKDVYRRVIYLKSEKYDTLVSVKDLMEKYIEMNEGYGRIRIQFDFNPMDIF